MTSDWPYGKIVTVRKPEMPEETRATKLSFCPVCHQPIKSEFYQSIGRKGGLTTKQRHDHAFYVLNGRQGGRGNKRNRRTDGTE